MTGLAPLKQDVVWFDIYDILAVSLIELGV